MNFEQTPQSVQLAAAGLMKLSNDMKTMCDATKELLQATQLVLVAMADDMKDMQREIDELRERVKDIDGIAK